MTGLHYTSSVLGPLVGPAAFGYSVDFWNGDLIASCVAAACLIAAGYFFAAKPPRVGTAAMSTDAAKKVKGANPSLKPNSLLAGKIQGILFVGASECDYWLGIQHQIQWFGNDDRKGKIALR